MVEKSRNGENLAGLAKSRGLRQFFRHCRGLLAVEELAEEEVRGEHCGIWFWWCHMVSFPCKIQWQFWGVAPIFSPFQTIQKIFQDFCPHGLHCNLIALLYIIGIIESCKHHRLSWRSIEHCQGVCTGSRHWESTHGSLHSGHRFRI